MTNDEARNGLAHRAFPRSQTLFGNGLGGETLFRSGAELERRAPFGSCTRTRNVGRLCQTPGAARRPDKTRRSKYAPAFHGIVLCALLIFILHPSSFILYAQDSTPPPQKSGVQLQFVPPPMEGAISLGVYDSAGKLVRVLHQEAPQTEFVAALNGLITFWDGKDDAGKLMPAGKYRARGYMAGAMDFEGVGFLGNDWITGSEPYRLRRLISMANVGSWWGNLYVFGEAPDGNAIYTRCDGANGQVVVMLKPASGGTNNRIPPPSNHADDKSVGVSQDSMFLENPAESWAEIAAGVNTRLTVADGRISIRNKSETRAIDLSEGESMVAACNDCEHGAWLIVRSGTNSEVREYSGRGEFLRHLAIAATEPQPVRIAATQTNSQGNAIYLLEQNDKLQRVRALVLMPQGAMETAAPPVSPTLPTSTWKVVFSKTITFSDTLDQARGLLKMANGQPFVPQEKITLRLLPNPLEQDKPGAVDIAIGIDAKGSFFKTADGLPLCRVSDTPNLRWAAMAREPDSKTVLIFQSDGAVVEEFKAGKLANMMAFDCGDFDFDPAKMK